MSFGLYLFREAHRTYRYQVNIGYHDVMVVTGESGELSLNAPIVVLSLNVVNTDTLFISLGRKSSFSLTLQRQVGQISYLCLRSQNISLLPGRKCLQQWISQGQQHFAPELHSPFFLRPI